jgi:ABC-2 type transport system ATP-binding protein
VAFAELEDFMDQKLKNYSSGMQVRLAFSVATRAEADILLVDEVLAVGDADFQRKCYDYFKSLKKTGKTVVFVTHDMGAVREYCDRAILIDKGYITHEGKSEAIADEYLKLFNTNDETTTDEDRWGNGWAKISNFKITKKEETLVLNVAITAKDKPVNDFTFGYRFKNSEGVIVAAGNSLVTKNGRSLSVDSNQTIKLKFVMPDFLGNDTYTLGASVRMNDKVTMCDNWEGITKIKSAKPGTYYPVWSPAVMEFEDA